MALETLQHLKMSLTLSFVVIGEDGKQQTRSLEIPLLYSDGNAANQLGQVFFDDSRALNNTSEELDLNGSTQKDFQGGNLDMTGLRVLFVQNLATASGDTVTVSQPASNGVPDLFAGAGDGIKIPPGGLLLWASPGTDDAPVTASTGDKLQIATNDNISYRVLAAGRNT